MRIPALLLPILIALPAGLAAQERGRQPPPRSMQADAQPGREGMSAAVRRVERATGGQVLNVESLRFEGREIHRVKVLTPQGRVMVVVDDPVNRRGPPQMQEFTPTRRDDTDRP